MSPEREPLLPPRPLETKTHQGPDLPWAQVAAQLRAYREEQRRAWGDVDNTTLGRYLAGEVSPDERQQVEQALEELPELRKLTDLVRDVLEDFEPATVPPPALVPFSAPPPTPRHKRSRSLQYASLALAASVLLTLGVVLPRSSMLAQVFDLPASTVTVASREPIGLPEDEVLLGAATPASAPARDREKPVVRAHPMLGRGVPLAPRGGPDNQEHPFYGAGSLPMAPPGPAVTMASAGGHADLMRKGGEAKAQRAEQQTVVALNQQAETYRRQGDLEQAATSYSQAHRICLRLHGPEHPETRRSLNNLADVYQAALNCSGEPAAQADARPVATAMAPAGLEALPGDGQQLHQSRMAHRPLQAELLECSPAQLKTDVVPVLVESLRQAKTSEERQQLALALGRLGPAARPAVPVLVDTLQNRADEPQERSILLTTLGQIGPGARQALPVLVYSVCNDHAPEARQSAAEALVQMGPAARGAVSDLIKPGMANDPLLRDVLRHIRGREGRIGVCDECDCFSAAALTQARATIRSLAKNANVEVLVETVSTLPSPATEQAANDLGPRGVHVVLGKDDRSVRVRVAPALQQQGITLVSLARAFAGPLREKHFDASLRAGVRFIARVEKARMPARR